MLLHLFILLLILVLSLMRHAHKYINSLHLYSSNAPTSPNTLCVLLSLPFYPEHPLCTIGQQRRPCYQYRQLRSYYCRWRCSYGHEVDTHAPLQFPLAHKFPSDDPYPNCYCKPHQSYKHGYYRRRRPRRGSHAGAVILALGAQPSHLHLYDFLYFH
jgi:hypothetical protein